MSLMLSMIPTSGPALPLSAFGPFAPPKPTTTTNITTGTHSGPWYAQHPLPDLHPHGLAIYPFCSSRIQHNLALLASGASGTAAAAAEAPAPASAAEIDERALDADKLLWTGSSVVNMMFTMMLPAMFPDLGSAQLTDLRAAMTSRWFAAHLARTKQLPEHFRLAQPHSDRSQAELYDAYVGGVMRENGSNNFMRVYTWWSDFNMPYARHFRAILGSLPPQISTGSGAVTSTPSATVTSFSDAAARASAEAKARRQNVAGFTSRLMEFCAKNRAANPSFHFLDNGQQGADISWKCTVMVDGTSAMGQASTKLEAKHLACREILTRLNALEPLGPSQNAVERRKKKHEKRLMRGSGGHGTRPYVAQQQLPQAQNQQHPHFPPPPFGDPFMTSGQPTQSQSLHARLNGLAMTQLNPYMPPPPGPGPPGAA